VRVYAAASEEALRARNLLKDWASEGFLTEAQYRRMEKETGCEFRTTNIFLRLVLFLFTLIIVGAATGLFFVVFLSRPSPQTSGVFLLIFAAVSDAGAEFAVSQARLYRYGIEEALAVCSVGFLCVGIRIAFFSGTPYLSNAHGGFLVPFAGVIFSLWLWHRFGLPYAFLAAMTFVLFLPGYWTSSHSAQHLIVTGFYAAGLTAVAAVRSRHRFDYLNDRYSLVEALLWLGIYLAINVQLSSLNLLGQWWGGPRAVAEFSGPFYWGTWISIWCLPPIALVRGVRRKDRLVLAMGGIIAILTLMTNKPYLGWQRHTWDPMLLGALLIGVALFLRRWFAGGPGEIRHGFSANRLSATDQHWLNAGAAVFGLLSPHPIAQGTQPVTHNVRFGGGDSAGGGATSDF
jgi:hypothetical protein